jgi:hypothetical protein
LSGSADHASFTYLTGVKTYYWATFLFLFLDIGFNVNIRVVGLAGFPVYKNFYYGLCLCCLGFIAWRPALAPLVAVVESGSNIALLCLGILLPIYEMPEQVLSGVPITPITTLHVLNFLVSGSVGVWSFHRGVISKFPKGPFSKASSG